MRVRGVVDVVALLAVTASLVGGASAARFLPGGVVLGPVGEGRFVLLSAALALLLLLLAMRPLLPVLRRGTARWIVGVLALHVWIAASFAWSDQTAFTYIQLYELLLLVVLLATILCSLGPDPSRGLRLVLGVTYALSVIVTLTSLVVSGKLPSADTLPGVGGIGMARILGNGVLAAVFFALHQRRAIWLAPVPFFLLGVFQSGSRAAVLALLAAASFWWWLASRRKAVLPAARLRFRVLLGGGAVALILVLATPFGRGALIAFGSSLVRERGPDPSDASELYLADRDVIFMHALESATLSFPGGLGLGSYVGPFGELYPHNLLLSFAVDAGVVALLVGGALLLYGFFRMARRRNVAIEAVLASAGFFFVASMFAGTYYDARHIWIYLMLGMLIQDSATRITAMRAIQQGRLLLPAR